MIPTRRIPLLSLVLLLVGSWATADADSPRPAQPNVVLILADDLGWQDVKCYDIDDPSPYDTPQLDAFAQKGVQFWQAYSPAPTCSPTRCAIISGVHPARAQKTHVVGGQPPHPRAINSRMMEPWYSGRMPEDTYTLARAMKANGYVTGHAGKWHIAINHNAFPQPEDVGFDFTRADRGAHRNMGDRLSGFATDAKDDPYQLDENGFPRHQNSEDALQFVQENKDQPFFLYYCTWLVHSPIMTRAEGLLEKYENRLGASRTDTFPRETPGHINPFYGAMVEMLDYYVGQMFHYLETTEDPRWPGHMLSENTYVIFTSDNGGMEGNPKERYTENFPLDRGKISAKEGGVRVPLLIAGPGISAGVHTDVMTNGLDFYPTILSLTGSPVPTNKTLDGSDLSALLHGDPTDASLVKQSDGSVRVHMMWHFPNSAALESTLRVGDFKLIRNYDHVDNDSTPELELFQLYRTVDGKQERVDIEEMNNIASDHPEKTQQLNRQLTQLLTAMDASYPSYNPDTMVDLPYKKRIPTVTAVKEHAGTVHVTYQENGAEVVRSQLIYTPNADHRYEEWFRVVMEPAGKGAFTIPLPEGATHYFVNLIDENQFLVSYPSLKDYKSGKTTYPQFALQVGK